MRTQALTFIVTLASLSLGGCIDTKDMSQDGSSEDSGGSDAAGTTTAGQTGGATLTATGQGPTSEDDGSTAAVTASTGDPTTGGQGTDDDGDTASDSATASTGATASEGGTDGNEQLLCETTGGTWDDTACGHYVCGQPNDCRAIDPGCDCGADANFTDEGCVDDDECSEPQLFACGDAATCTAGSEYCEEFFPGVPGSDITYTCMDIPAACSADPSCECLESEDVIPDLKGECMGEPDTGLTVSIFAP